MHDNILGLLTLINYNNGGAVFSSYYCCCSLIILLSVVVVIIIMFCKNMFQLFFLLKHKMRHYSLSNDA